MAAIVRLVRLLQITNSLDVPYDSYDVCIWTAVEISTGLFCACAPATKPLLRKLVPQLISSVSGSTNGSPAENFKSRHVGLGTKKNRGMTNNALELSSETDFEFGSNERGGRVWADGKGRKNGFGGDDESEIAVLSNAAPRGETRTVKR